MSVRDVAAAASVSVGTVSNVLNRPGKVVALDSRARARQPSRSSASCATTPRVSCGPDAAAASRSSCSTSATRSSPTSPAARRPGRRGGNGVLLGNSDERPTGSRLPRPVRAAACQRRAITPVDDPRRGSSDSAPAAPGRPRRPRGRRAALLLGLRRRRRGRLPGGVAPARDRSPRIAFVGGLGDRQVARSPEGARRAVAEVPGATLEVIETGALSVLAGTRGRRRLRGRDRADRPDAVFAANDLLAVGPCRPTLMADLQVPGHRADRLRRHRLRGGDRGAPELDPPAGASHRLHRRRPAPQGHRGARGQAPAHGALPAGARRPGKSTAG